MWWGRPGFIGQFNPRPYQIACSVTLMSFCGFCGQRLVVAHGTEVRSFSSRRGNLESALMTEAAPSLLELLYSVTCKETAYDNCRVLYAAKYTQDIVKTRNTHKTSCGLNQLLLHSFISVFKTGNSVRA